MADGGGAGDRRLAAGVVGLVLLGLAVWLAAAVTGPHMAEELGFAPPTGVLTVDSCRAFPDAWGATQGGDDCTGHYTPNGGGRAYTVTLHNASRPYAKGTRVPVRLVGGRPYEPSAVRFGGWAFLTVAVLALPIRLLRHATRRPRPTLRHPPRRRPTTRRAAHPGGLPILWIVLSLPAYLLLTLTGYVVIGLR